MDPVEAVTESVTTLAEALQGLLDACTDPQATDMAELLADIQAARLTLYGVERDVELTLAKAMLDDNILTPTLRVERSRGTDRKAWDHEGWQRDLRRQVLRAKGLAGAQGVVTASGEVLDAAVIVEAIVDVENAHGSTAPKTTSLRAFGLDARDYCESSPGAWRVKVTRMNDVAEDGAA